MEVPDRPPARASGARRGRRARDGVFAMQDYYAKSGFVFSHRESAHGRGGMKLPALMPLVEMHTLPFEQVVEISTERISSRSPCRNFSGTGCGPKEGLALWLST